MKTAKLLFAAFLVFAPLSLSAQTPPAAPNATFTPAPILPSAGASSVVTTNVPGIIPAAAPPAVTQNTISTTGPVDSSTTISVGTLAGQVLAWLSAVFVPVIGIFLTRLLMAMAQKAGVQASQAMSDRLDQIIENGLHSGANTAQADLTGRLNVNVKNDVIKNAVQYAQTHAGDTIKSLTGADPTDPKVIETLQARATKVLAGIGPDAPVQSAVPVPPPVAPIAAAPLAVGLTG
jgi:hypothetical protein